MTKSPLHMRKGYDAENRRRMYTAGIGTPVRDRYRRTAHRVCIDRQREGFLPSLKTELRYLPKYTRCAVTIIPLKGEH